MTKEINEASLRQQKHYDQIAGQYVGGRRAAPAYTAFLDVWAQHLLKPWIESRSADARAHDVAIDPMCGHGNLAPYLLAHCGRLILNDISQSMLDHMEPDLRTRAEVLAASDVCHLQVESATADVVVISGGLHHVFSNLDDALREIHRVLKPGGLFLYGEPSNDFAPVRIARNTIYRMSPSFDHQTEHAFRESELREYLVTAGYDNIEMRYFGSLGYLLMGQVSLVPLLKRSRSDRLFRMLRNIDSTVENSRFLKRTCLALLGSARKPMSS